MKGIILAGGSGTRLYPLTKVTSKQLLPVYDQPMVFFPLQTLMQAGIREVLFIVAPDHAGDYLNSLGSGSKFGCQFTYEIQDKPAGLAQGLSLAEGFVGGDNCMLILGDNIYEHNFTNAVQSFTSGGHIFVKEVPDPERFGVVELDDKMHVVSIEEKPQQPKSHYAQTGVYIYDQGVFDHIRTMKPSPRGELEITDLNNIYLSNGALNASVISGQWIDAGTIESLFKAAEFRRNQLLTQSKA